MLLSPEARFAAAALAVPLLATLTVHVRAVHPRALKRVGWTMVAADSVSLALLLLL